MRGMSLDLADLDTSGGLDLGGSSNMDIDLEFDWNEDKQDVDQLKNDFSEALAPVQLPFRQPVETKTPYDEYNEQLRKHSFAICSQLTQELQKCGWQQRQLVPKSATSEQLKQHGALLRALRSKMDQVQRDAQRALVQSPLQCAASHAVREMIRVVHMLQRQLEVFCAEWTAFFDESFGERPKIVPPVRLCIVRQSCDRPVKQNSPQQVALEVRVLAGAHCELRPASSVQCILECPSSQSTTQVPLENCECPLQPDGGCSFSELKFPAGSRTQLTYLKCRLQIKWSMWGQQGQMNLVSESSDPLVVVTTESQWAPALGKIIMQSLFRGGQQVIPWIAFCNAIQRYYLEATRQEQVNPPRPLSLHDLSYIHQFKFGNADPITPQAFDSFWSWFGTVCVSIRHSRLLHEMWTRGYLMGFISKNAAESLLQGRAPGTFLLRFSERVAGQFAIAYVKRSKGQDVVKHYLIKPGDVAPPQRTLADFLGSQPYFVYLLQTIPCLGPSNTARWTVVHKDAALSPFYGDKGQSLDGYDEELPAHKAPDASDY